MIPFLQKTLIKAAFAAGPLQRIMIFERDGRVNEINRPR
jgi:hypothetical protein